nr:hypothetical protein [Fimbriimonadaceae bacterium]
EEMGITISELASALESQIRTFRASGEQIPVVFGPANRRLFDTRVEVTETGFRITRESDRVIYVEAGQALGVRPGYRFAIVPRSARRFTPGQEGAILARVANEKDIEPDRTRIVLDQPLPNASGMKAFIAEVSPDMVLRVDLDSLIGTKYYDLARQVLSPQIQEKQRGRGADVVILPPSPVPVRPGFPHQAKAFGVYSNSGTVDFAEDKKRNGFDSVTRSASLSADLPDGEWVSRLARIFRNASRHKALLAIKPVPDVVVIEAEMVEVELPDGVANPANYRILSGSEEQRKGGIATGIRFFGLKMRSQQRGDLLPGPGFSRFLDVLTVTPDGEVAHLWPRGGAEGDTRQSLPANGEWYYLGQQGKLLPVSGYGGQGKLAIFYQSPNEHGFGEGVLRIFGTKQADIPFASLATNSSDLSRSATTSGSSLGSLISDFGSGGNFTDRSAMRLDGWSLVDLRTQFKK